MAGDPEAQRTAAAGELRRLILESDLDSDILGGNLEDDAVTCDDLCRIGSKALVVDLDRRARSADARRLAGLGVLDHEFAQGALAGLHRPGGGPARRTHVLVKPIASGLRTNLVITTDRRVYLVALESRAGEGMAAISWTYPGDGLIALDAAAATAPVARGVALDRLDFNYRIEGDRAPWMPVRAFDDGTQTFIQFPPSVGSGEIPPLFVVGPSGRTELVNYRLSGRYYVVDRLFSRAELRLGEKHQLIVRIIRTDARRRGRAE